MTAIILIKVLTICGRALTERNIRRNINDVALLDVGYRYHVPAPVWLARFAVHVERIVACLYGWFRTRDA